MSNIKFIKILIDISVKAANTSHDVGTKEIFIKQTESLNKELKLLKSKKKDKK